MATIYRCDRCRYESTDHLNTVKIPHPRSSSLDWEVQKDLCDSCLGQLLDFVKPIPELRHA